ncbi:hypothetical protein SAMN05216323_101073 [Williamwhitmania taraxaci]|uniref:Uncharacterized protein n=1 Tax=Williamwhitmania taraxaci TaxID=1640674 RepID=A0A1G6HGR6_9BACT|nr:hypothetical protein SAMN05216323_101073 [Williamwhitmania taraxaci]
MCKKGIRKRPTALLIVQTKLLFLDSRFVFMCIIHFDIST